MLNKNKQAKKGSLFKKKCCSKYWNVVSSHNTVSARGEGVLFRVYKFLDRGVSCGFRGVKAHQFERNPL